MRVGVYASQAVCLPYFSQHATIIWMISRFHIVNTIFDFDQNNRG